MVTDADQHVTGSTPRKDEARSTITRTTITPAPGTETAPTEVKKPSIFERFGPRTHGDLTSAEAPFPGVNILRLVMSLMLTGLCLLTVGGAILVLLLWQQDRASGVLTNQLERTWDLFDTLRIIERYVAFAVVPVATAWIAVATINVRRATGERRNPIIAAASLPIGVIGAWYVGRELVAAAEDWVGEASGFVLQAIFLLIPLIALLRVAQAAEARHRPLRAAFVVSVAFVGAIQFLGGLSTVDQTSQPEEWGRLGAYLIIAALLQVLGALSANEAARAIEEGTQHRYELRHRFGESLLSQAVRS